MRFLFPFLIAQAKLRNFVVGVQNITRKTRTRDVTALDDETFSEKKENKKKADQKKRKSSPQILLATETNKERERDTRERKRKI